MPQDAFTLNYLCKELDNTLKKGKINKIVQPNNECVIFTVYTGKDVKNLLIDVTPSNPRINVFDFSKTEPNTPPNFCMLLRKHLLSATIESISLIGFDRVVEIVLTSSSEFFDQKQKVIYVELMGRYSNIILTEDGKVLGCNRGINSFDNGVRPLIVGLPYTNPPTNEKLVPSNSDLIDYFNRYAGDSLANYIVNGVQGLALTTAIKIVEEYSKNFDINIVDGKKLFDFINEFLYRAKLSPCVKLKGKELVDMQLFPYDSGEYIYFNSVSEAENYYFDTKLKAKRFQNKFDRLNNLINTAIKKVKKRLGYILAKEKDASDIESIKIYGELILANIYKIRKGEKNIKLLNYYTNEEVEVLLDENLTPSENAESYYKKYTKKKRTLEALIPQRESAEVELNYFQSLLEELSICKNEEDLVHVYKEAEEYGIIKAQKKKSSKQKETINFREYFAFGFTIRVGRNNIENDLLTSSARANDIWVHVKDYHSSHAIIYAESRSIPEKVIEIAGKISAYYSKARESGKAEIVYADKRFVKKPKKAKPGFFIYTDFKSMVVEPSICEEYLKRN